MTKRTDFQKMVKSAVECMMGGVARVTCKANGSVEVRRSYFYTFGWTPENWAAKVAKAVEGAGMAVKVEGKDEWAAWPKTSYFVAVVSEAK